MRRAQLVLSANVLETLLQLREGIRITGTEYSVMDRTTAVILEGNGLPGGYEERRGQSPEPITLDTVRD